MDRELTMMLLRIFTLVVVVAMSGVVGALMNDKPNFHDWGIIALLAILDLAAGLTLVFGKW